MLIYPFKTIWLKTQHRRETIANLITDQTYLSDATYRKSDAQTKFFYGTVSDAEFVLEAIKGKRMAGHVEGDIVGVGDDTYVKLSLGALRHKRIYVLLIALLLGSSVFWFRAFFGFERIDAIIFNLFSTVWILLLLYAFYFLWQFQRNIQPSIDFFRGLLQADLVEENVVPAIFKR